MVFKLARQVFIDELRRRKKDANFPLNDDLAHGDASMEEVEISWELEQAILTLSPDQATVVILDIFYGMTNLEIAQQIDKTEGAVKSLFHRAKKT